MVHKISNQNIQKCYALYRPNKTQKPGASVEERTTSMMSGHAILPAPTECREERERKGNAVTPKLREPEQSASNFPLSATRRTRNGCFL